jgi:hypothetical protein
MPDSTEYVPFGRLVRDLLIEKEITTGMGNPNWSAFAEKLETVHYETLRKAVTGERAPSPKVMEEVAAALGLDPTTFVEYRIWQAQRQFDPREVGAEVALAALAEWTAYQKRRK